MPLKKKNVDPGDAPEVMTPPAEEQDNTPAETASAERLQAATELVSRKFGLGGNYAVTEFNDKGKVVKLTLDGSEFIVSVTIKNTEDHPGFYTQQ